MTDHCRNTVSDAPVPYSQAQWILSDWELEACAWTDAEKERFDAFMHERLKQPHTAEEWWICHKEPVGSRVLYYATPLFGTQIQAFSLEELLEKIAKRPLE